MQDLCRAGDLPASLCVITHPWPEEWAGEVVIFLIHLPGSGDRHGPRRGFGGLAPSMLPYRGVAPNPARGLAPGPHQGDDLPGPAIIALLI